MAGLSLVSGFMLGTFDQMGSAVLQTGSQVTSLCVVLLGNMALWGGLLNVAQKSGLTDTVSRLMTPAVKFLFPAVKQGSKLFHTLCMSIMANLLGLGAAATPLGLQAMQLLKGQSTSDTATDDMATLVILNTASFQILPTTAAVLRQKAGSSTPMDILFPVWAATGVSLAAALLLNRLLRRKM